MRIRRIPFLRLPWSVPSTSLDFQKTQSTTSRGAETGPVKSRLRKKILNRSTISGGATKMLLEGSGPPATLTDTRRPVIRRPATADGWLAYFVQALEIIFDPLNEKRGNVEMTDFNKYQSRNVKFRYPNVRIQHNVKFQNQNVRFQQNVKFHFRKI
jgi:hypothetical protein